MDQQHKSGGGYAQAKTGFMRPLFEKDQLPVPSKGAQAEGRQNYAERRVSPVVAGLRVTSINPALTMSAGHVRLDALNDSDWPRQLSDFLHQYGRLRSTNFSKTTSEETLRNRTDILFSTVRMLMDDKQLKHLKTLSQIKPRHLPRMFELWSAKGISKRAQINYFNVVRWFWRICGMEIDSIRNFETEKGEFTINRNADRDKSWKGNGVDFQDIYKRLHELDPVGARLAMAMKQYGLRVKESLCLEPHKADDTDRLLITKGTKTGRPRQLMFEVFDDENFRRVLDDLKEEVPADCHLAWKNRTLKQAKLRMQYIARKAKLTRKDLGVTWHGLRHDFAIDHLENLTGQTAPIRGGVAINYRALSDARLKVTQALGHNRLKVTGAYYGSFLSMERDQLRAFTRSWERIEPVMKEVGELLQGSLVDNLYWIGARALGAIGANEMYEFTFAPDADDATALLLAPQIAELVLGTTGVDCVVHNWKSMPGIKQALWEVEGVPIFKAVSPLEYMKGKLEEQKAARMKDFQIEEMA